MGREKIRDFIRFMKLPLLICPAYGAIFLLFHRYDWGHPLVKAGCFIALFAMVLLVSRGSGEAAGTPAFFKIETALWAALIILVFSTWGVRYSRALADPARCDIGYTTHHAVQQLVLGHADPYESSRLFRLGDDPKYWGYRYGPGMVLFYLPAAWFSSASLKVITLVYGLLAFSVLAYLLYDRHKPRWHWAAATAFALLLMVLSERVWYEIMVQGSTDLLPILLLLMAVALTGRGSLLPAGICAGLSFTAKFAPALFFILLFVRKRPNIRFFGGVALGSIPLLAFLAWSGEKMLNNVFFVNAVKPFDSTSLYSVTPPALHLLFPLIQLTAAAFFIAVNFTGELDDRRIAVHYTLLLIIIEATYREVHTNHLLWFLPFLALIFARHRHAVAAPAITAPPVRKGGAADAAGAGSRRRR